MPSAGEKETLSGCRAKRKKETNGHLDVLLQVLPLLHRILHLTLGFTRRLKGRVVGYLTLGPLGVEFLAHGLQLHETFVGSVLADVEFLAHSSIVNLH